ncbi:d-isomer specific 2-hydroxyacid dehydrogenase family protein [Niveomyces insectorum RCEF 264]|uniref:D-isomer specific 2-hydroxyacid dehydrogenase family protein n=1 Tax=Niveomyces insectorum RCEF 264 TaxID=1081102 RepID=A0A167VRF9_9HYPO|nr:d-isomer specific 2-hydroxyacid dehydrogenase family protein [Niveomyces insectorum RCEF 264]
MAPIKVAVLDDYKNFAGPAFANLDPSVFEVSHFPDTSLPYNHPDTPQDAKDKLVARLLPFQAISTMRERTPFPAELVARLPNLKLLLTTGNRNLALDLPAFEKEGIPVVGAVNRAGPPEGPDSTTQHFLALVLAAARSIPADDAAVKEGGWQAGLAPFGLAGKVYGTVGLGRLGAKTAKILHESFNMQVIAWSPNLTQDKADAQARDAGLPVVDSRTGQKTFRAVSREELFATADVVAVHLVLSERSRGLITGQDLGRMKKDSIFVNTSRGPIVVEADLLEALEKGTIDRAALDVFDIEPLPADSPWRTTAWGRDGRGQVVLTPHTGYGERLTMEKWYAEQAENLRRFAQGEELQNRMI